MTDVDGLLDPAYLAWLEANPYAATPLEQFPAELLVLARTLDGPAPTRPIAHVRDDVLDGVPVRVYSHDSPPTGVVVYFHGGGWVMGSVGLMDHIAREVAHHTGSAVISVGYRLAPEHPFPAGLDDCETVTRWALKNAEQLAAPSAMVAVAGESAGGNLAAAVALRLRDAGGPSPIGQILIYPAVDNGTAHYASREQFDGVVLSRSALRTYWSAYAGGTDIDRLPFSAPIHATDLSALPPALLVLAGCDLLLDEARAYASRLRQSGVAVEEVICPGQPHGYINFGLPAAATAYEHIAAWLRGRFTT